MILTKVTKLISNSLNIDNKLITLIIITIIVALIFKGLSLLIDIINRKMHTDSKQLYLRNKRKNTILTIIFILILTIVWRDVFKNIMTFITFMSAAITLAARDIIFDYFCGIYIKLTRPIKIEDRIKIGDYIGDIVNINALNFELLEVDLETNQSTGIIIHIPNSLIFNTPLKNYNKAFKYVWDEIKIRISLDSDIDLAKQTLLKITSSHPIVKEIPKKMQKEIEKSVSSYRIYYNNLTPIVYTEIKEDLVYLTIRFLVHPKKQRNIENDLYTNILKTFRQNNIEIK